MRVSDWSSDVCSSDLVEVEGRHRVGGAIRADLLGVVVEHREACAHPRLDHQSGEAEVALGHAADGSGDPGHRGAQGDAADVVVVPARAVEAEELLQDERSEEHTSELQSLMRISY